MRKHTRVDLDHGLVDPRSAVLQGLDEGGAEQALADLSQPVLPDPVDELDPPGPVRLVPEVLREPRAGLHSGAHAAPGLLVGERRSKHHRRAEHL